MAGICPKCGLPQDICVCDTLEKETSSKIVIYVDKKRFGKVVTIIQGLDDKQIGKVAKDLKHMLSTGGTGKDGIILLQGDHKVRVKEALLKLGYKEENLNVR